VYLSNATVAANNSDVTINWLVDSANVRLTYQIMGSTDSITYTELERFDSVDWNVTRGEYSTVLNNLTPERNQYFFKIITSCSCPDTIDTTFVTKVVRLQASLLTENTNRVFWQDYEGWIQDVGYMEIHRVTLDPVTLTQRDTLLATLLPGVNEYIDNDSASFGAGQVISYYLRSFEQVGNPLGGGVRSQSNFAYIYREIQILAPTAFTPNGINNIFLPKIQSAYNNQFNMKIFNRWGKLVFETNDEFLGWDGRDRDSGDICAPGSYVYLIKANNSSGKTLEKVGNIALID
jgi:gliding motility-associated-like protein